MLASVVVMICGMSFGPFIQLVGKYVLNTVARVHVVPWLNYSWFSRTFAGGELMDYWALELSIEPERSSFSMHNTQVIPSNNAGHKCVWDMPTVHSTLCMRPRLVVLGHWLCTIHCSRHCRHCNCCMSLSLVFIFQVASRLTIACLTE